MWSRPAAPDVGPVAGPLAVAAEVAHVEGAPPTPHDHCKREMWNLKRHSGETIWIKATAAVSLCDCQPVYKSDDSIRDSLFWESERMWKWEDTFHFNHVERALTSTPAHTSDDLRSIAAPGIKVVLICSRINARFEYSENGRSCDSHCSL